MYERQWYVLHVVANHEKRVAQHLAVRSVEHYLPLYQETSRWTDRTVQLKRPLFTGYVFTRFSPQQRLSVISVPGVLHLLGDTITDTVSAEELERIRLALMTGYSLRPHPRLAIGTEVQVRGGVFDGVKGLVAELRRECKVVIAVAAVQQCFSLEVGIDQIELLNKPPRDAGLSYPGQLANART